MIIVPTMMRSQARNLILPGGRRQRQQRGATDVWGGWRRGFGNAARAASWREVVLALAIAAAMTMPAAASDHGPPPAGEAISYPAVEIHEDEKVAIAVDPCDTSEKQSFLKVDYLKHRFMAIRIIITNNGDKPISLNDARIDFISADGDKIPAAVPEDVERRTTNTARTGKRIPLPAPLPPIREKPKSSDKKIEADFNTYEYAALAVEPHTTRAGYLFYDMTGLGPTPLHGAKLEFRLLRNAEGKELFAFEVPFDKYLDAKK